MKTWVLGLLIVLSSGQLRGQAPDTTWTGNYGGPVHEWCRALVALDDGGYALAGATRSFGSGQYDMYLVRTDSVGDTLWTRVYDGVSEEWANALVATADGGFLLTGYTYSYGAGNADVYLVRVDSTGTILWTRTYGGIREDRAYAAQLTSDGGFIVAGYTYTYGPGIPTFPNVYLLRLNAAGDTLWTRVYGGTDDDRAYAVAELTDGGIAVAGYSYSNSLGLADMYLLRTDSAGDTLWSRKYGASNFESAYGLLSDSANGILLVGTTNSFGSGSQVYLLECSPDGNVNWSRVYGGSGFEEGYAVSRSNDGGYLISGKTNSIGAGGYDVYFIKTDAAGDTLWTGAYGGPSTDEGYAVLQTPDSGFALAGMSASYGNGNQMYLVKLGQFSPLFVPERLVVRYSGGNLRFDWSPVNNPYYRIYSDTLLTGQFRTLEGSTADTTLTIPLPANRERLFRVVGTRLP